MNQSKENDTLFQARYEAQKIAFGPVVFQVTQILKDSGILKFIRNTKSGVSFSDIEKQFDISRYGLKVLLETGLSANLVSKNDDIWKITQVGMFILKDEMTRVNMNFVDDVCYDGLQFLKESFETGKPEGYLRCFEKGPDNVYDALETLPEKVQKSWFEFDHFYSDTAFPDVLPEVFAYSPKKIMDIGGNTGKWAKACTSYSSDVELTIVDLPSQIGKAKTNLSEHPGKERVGFFEVEDIVKDDLVLPRGHDLIWMSQFICCFSEADMHVILKKAYDALEPGGKICIMDTFWDKQKYDIASYCIINTSPYFSCIANGKGKMMAAEDLLPIVEKTGLKVIKEIGIIGFSHTLLILEKKMENL